MNRYLIEVPHDENKKSCELAVKTFLDTGSHFLTHADWGCADEEHKAWIIVDLETKEEALRIVPPQYRENTKVVQLEKFTVEDIDEKLWVHHK